MIRKLRKRALTVLDRLSTCPECLHNQETDACACTDPDCTCDVESRLSDWTLGRTDDLCTSCMGTGKQDARKSTPVCHDCGGFGF